MHSRCGLLSRKDVESKTKTKTKDKDQDKDKHKDKEEDLRHPPGGGRGPVNHLTDSREWKNEWDRSVAPQCKEGQAAISRRFGA
jgi:hypothetical protein